jgi:hypothetical protein
MNTAYALKKITGLGPLLALSLGFAISAKAGPGLDYWRRLDQIKVEKQAQPAQLPSANSDACSDAKTIAITEVQKDWVNGRGPLHFVQVGTKQVCHSCGATTVLKKSWPNARGPLEAVEIPAEHTCTSCGTKTHV